MLAHGRLIMNSYPYRTKSQFNRFGASFAIVPINWSENSRFSLLARRRHGPHSCSYHRDIDFNVAARRPCAVCWTWTLLPTSERGAASHHVDGEVDNEWRHSGGSGSESDGMKLTFEKTLLAVSKVMTVVSLFLPRGLCLTTAPSSKMVSWTTWRSERSDSLQFSKQRDVCYVRGFSTTALG